MIESIDIANFGCFKNFDWKNRVKNNKGGDEKFHRVNIIYGRNYTGKTTLSRIFRSLETQTIPQNYEKPLFLINPHSENISQDQIKSCPYDLRVYNKDFVEENLSFLKDDQGGRINSFAILGKHNVEISKKMDELIERIGSIESEKGIQYKLDKASREATTALYRLSNDNKALDDLLKDKANNKNDGIKYNKLYNDINYDIRKIKKDIEEVLKKHIEPLENTRVEELKVLLSEKPLPEIEMLEKPVFLMSEIYKNAKILVSKKIQPSKPIQELLNDNLLQVWVKEGILLHESKKTHCGFCRQELPTDLWESLNAHFNKASTDLEADLVALKEKIKQELEEICKIGPLKKEQFYSGFQGEYVELFDRLTSSVSIYKENLSTLASCLVARLTDIFSPIDCPEIHDNQSEIEEIIDALNDLSVKNKQKTDSLSEQQKQVVDVLRLNEIKIFIDRIKYLEKVKSLKERLLESQKKQSEREVLIAEMDNVIAELRDLESELGDEKKGAEKVNLLLNHYFGNQRLKLVPIEDASKSIVRFQIERENAIAYNLSEGECSLVAFCYFIAKLEDIDSINKELIIYIDDPISSLDANHIFFIYSLIESLIAAPQKDQEGKNVYQYKQLFISTHNLEFLKYLKRLSVPKLPSSSKKDLRHFMISERMSTNVIEVMPRYLKSYITEFNYLFSEICICAIPFNGSEDHRCFYNFGNNLRKFLEAFLYFKYPYSKNESGDHINKIAEFFGDSPIDAPLVQRITNEYSHLVGMFDKSMQPIDQEEITKTAKFVLSKIQENDPAQYKSLLASVDLADPL